MKFESINPYTEERLAQFDFISDTALSASISKADDTFSDKLLSELGLGFGSELAEADAERTVAV